MNGTSSRKRLLVRGRKRLILAIKLAVVVGALGYLFASGRLQLSDLLVADGGWKWLGAAVFTCLLILSLCHIRYWILLNASGVPTKAGRVLRAGYIGNFLNATFAGGLGFVSSDAIKAFYLMRDSDQRTAIVCVTLVDRIIGITGLFTLAALALQLGQESLSENESVRMAAAMIYGILAATGLGVVVSIISILRGRPLAFAAWILLGTAAGFWLSKTIDSGGVLALSLAVPLVLLLIAPSFLEGGPVNRFLGRFGRPGRAVCTFISTVTAFHASGGRIALAYGMSVLIHFLWIGGIYFAASGITTESTPTFGQIWFAAPPANLMSILPLPAGGLGVGEAAFDAMLRLMVSPEGLAMTGGAAIYLAFRITLTIACLSGLPFFLMTPKRALKAPEGSRFDVVEEENES